MFLIGRQQPINKSRSSCRFQESVQSRFLPWKHVSNIIFYGEILILGTLDSSHCLLFRANFAFLAKKKLLVVCFDFVKALNLQSCILAVSSFSYGSTITRLIVLLAFQRPVLASPNFSDQFLFFVFFFRKIRVPLYLQRSECRVYKVEVKGET